MVPLSRSKRKFWSQPLAEIVAPCLTASLARFGFDDAGLLVSWPAIVGERLAARCDPVKLQWPPRRSSAPAGETATLVVRVDGSFAIELQHQAPTVIERINQHLGWRCVGRIALRQAPAPARPAPRVRAAPPGNEALRAARAIAGPGLPDDLSDALTRLGARVIEARSRLRPEG